MQSSSSQKVTAFINVLAFAILVTANCLSIFLPLNGKTQQQLSAQYPNMLTPAGYAFSIWGIIYTLLFGFVAYQLYVLVISWHVGKKRILNISPLFVGVCLCNAGWLFAWHYEYVTLSVVIMIVHLLLLVLISERLHLSITWQSLSAKLWLDIPFSIYLGWICVALIVNIAAWLVSMGYTLSFLAPQVWTIVMMIAALLIGIFFIFTRNNKFLALAIAWGIYGVVARHKSVAQPASHAIVLAGYIVLAVLLLIIFLNTIRRREPENEPDMSA